MTSSSRKKIYTKYGDEGSTSLLYGGRVSKNNVHTEAYGITDEAVSAMGLARALSDDPRVRDVLVRLQRELFIVGAELATDPERYEVFNRHFKPVTAVMVAGLEELIDGLEAEAEMPNVFILPGGSPASAAMDVARTMTRTAERRCVALNEQGGLTNPEILHYMNRLGDLLFVLARYHDRELPIERATGDQA
jgi:cob(I)alamin adenosyltransferase